MAGISISRAWQVIKPHVPMIKFRKGALSAMDAQGTGTPSQHSAGTTGAGKKPQVTLRPVIEDYQLPLRYRRRPLDENEIAYINRGGPE